MINPSESDVYLRQIDLGNDKTASLRLACRGKFKAIICRINWPYREGIVIPFDSLKENTECDNENCTCKEDFPSDTTITTLELCKSCLKSIHKKIKDILEKDPQYPLAYNI